MKKQLLTVLMAVSLTGTAFIASAGDGTINFTGSIIADACTVASASEYMTVNLGKISSTAFVSVGDKAAATNFQINLVDCPETYAQASVKFDGKADANNPQLLALDESGDDASGVAIEISDNTGAIIPLYTVSKYYAIDTGTGTVSMDFSARYVATEESVNPGGANGISQFTINYQ